MFFMSCATGNVSNVCVSLLSCVDNYVFLLCIVSLSLLKFLMSVCLGPLPFCVDNYVDFYVLCHCSRV